MEEWVLWMVAAGLLAVGEMFTLGFFLGPVAIAAVTAAIVALAGGGVALQWIVFTVIAGGSLLVLRPMRLRTGTAALIGCPAIVLERVDGRSGQVKIGGEIWSARSFDEDSAFEPGARVEVLKIEGATALVAE
jgi:membrane protein implicated in regulation of membrane protease activity